MSVLEVQYDSIDAVPEQFRELYSDQDGVAVLTGVAGIKTQTDIANLQEALRKERNDHRQVREAFNPFKDLNYEDVQSQLDRIPALEAAAEGKAATIDDALKQQLTAPLQRQIDGIARERDDFKGQFEQLQSSLLRRDLSDAVRTIATEMKVIGTAIPDVEMVAERYLERTESGDFIVRADVRDITPGLDVRGFLKEMQRLRPHWWPASEGGGSGGGGKGGGIDPAKNPFSAKGWNLTRQGEIIRGEGTEVAARMATAAGTTVGGARPKE